MPDAPQDPMPGMPFQYATLRVVPDVERSERLNAGVVLLCRPARFLDARVQLDEDLLARLAPSGLRVRQGYCATGATLLFGAHPLTQLQKRSSNASRGLPMQKR